MSDSATLFRVGKYKLSLYLSKNNYSKQSKVEERKKGKPQKTIFSCAATKALPLPLVTSL